MPVDATQSLANLRLERDAILLYDQLAAIEKDAQRASAFRRIAGNEIGEHLEAGRHPLPDR